MQLSTETIILNPKTTYMLSLEGSVMIFDLEAVVAFERRQENGPFCPLWVQTANYTPAAAGRTVYDEWIDEDVVIDPEPESGVLVFERLHWDANGVPVLPKGNVRMTRGQINLEDGKISFDQVSWINGSSYDEENWGNMAFSRLTPPKSIEAIQVPADHQMCEEQKTAVFQHRDVGVIKVFMHLTFAGPSKYRGVLVKDGQVSDLVYTCSRDREVLSSPKGQLDLLTGTWTTARGLAMKDKYPYRRNRNWFKKMNHELV